MTRRLLAFIFVVLGVTAFYQLAAGNANAKENDVTTAGADIAFGDPVHSAFFKYQGFLAHRKSGGETAETWKLLAAPERLKKVKNPGPRPGALKR